MKSLKPIFVDVFTIIGVLVFFIVMPSPILLEDGCRFYYDDAWQEKVPLYGLLIIVFSSVFYQIYRLMKFLSERNSHNFNEVLIAIFRIIIFVILSFSLVYYGYGINRKNIDDIDQLSQIFDALYFSIVTFTTLGYGDYTPCSSMKLFAAMQALFGIFLLPFSSAIIVVEYSKKQS